MEKTHCPKKRSGVTFLSEKIGFCAKVTPKVVPERAITNHGFRHFSALGPPGAPQGAPKGAQSEPRGA